eukprot:TRINITY_DN2725_c0_g1_i6.p2 TRINITY_DN2725_c0_g1~~TRINITY_DN2725_c0_g1_i6.p2  ORF type:complete len:208 (+),score=52.24 TRINITY_DN2725_c0_g1_i6:1053-1676(+)
MGIATGLFSAYTTLQSLSSFMQNCASKNNFEWFFSTSESSSASSGATSTDIKASTGFVLLFMATVLKLFDVVCHVIVPTPVQKHGYMPAEGCEGPSLEGYMQECAQECEWGKPIEHAPDSPSLLVDGPTSAAPAQEAPEVTLDSKPVEAPEPMAGSLTIGEGTGGGSQPIRASEQEGQEQEDEAEHETDVDADGIAAAGSENTQEAP